MKILFTGGSSFTGFWFVKELIEAGHEIFVTFTNNSFENYSGLKRGRISQILNSCKPIWGCKFGDDQFLEIIKENKFDIFCNHAAFTNDYKSESFNLIEALKLNTYNIKDVFLTLKNNDCNTIIFTGSIFELDEGVGEKPLKAFSLYGLSKSFTYQIFKYYSDYYNMKLGKFVIPNPFGPYEEQRFTTYLVKQWIEKKIPEVRTPKYIRDNIHVTLLAKVYCYFLDKVIRNDNRIFKINPSGYIESQGDFAKRFANEIGKRLNIDTPLKFIDQREYIEPVMRVNYDKSEILISNWSEEKAWDELAEYYIQIIYRKLI